jgi:hypothetical protein
MDVWWLKKGGAHMKEWMNKTPELTDRAFSLSNNRGVKCPCSKCKNAIHENKMTLILQLYKICFMLGYEVWMHQCVSIC